MSFIIRIIRLLETAAIIKKNKIIERETNTRANNIRETIQQK